MEKIADELGLDPCWVRSKWKNLRDTYCRILKTKKKSDRGNRRKKWMFEEQLSFLKFPYETDYEPQCVELSDEYIDEINAIGMNCDSLSLIEQLEDKSDEDYHDYLAEEETPNDSILASGNNNVITTLDGTYYQTTTDNNCENENIDYDESIASKYIEVQSPKKMRIDDENNIIETNDEIYDNDTMPIIIETRTIDDTNICQNTNMDNTSMINNQLPKTSVELFFNSMAQTVKSLPPKVQAEIKLNVCRIVTAAETKHLKNKTTIKQFIAPPGMIPKVLLIPCDMLDN